MRRTSACLAVIALTFSAPAFAQQWGDLKGQVIWDPAAPLPKQDAVVLQPPQAAQCNGCAKGAAGLEEDYVINPKSRGLANVFVWIRPDGLAKDAAFPQQSIHPNLLKPAKPGVEVDQPCCKFIPHVLAAREGQKMTIKNTAAFAHNAKWDSGKNGGFNPIIEAGKQFELKNALVAESSEISLSCSIHPWMKAHIRVFDHPYFAVTDEDGKFTIKDAPVGKFNVFIHHPATGWYNGKAGSKGTPINIANGVNELGVYKMKQP